MRFSPLSFFAVVAGVAAVAAVAAVIGVATNYGAARYPRARIFLVGDHRYRCVESRSGSIACDWRHPVP